MTFALTPTVPLALVNMRGGGGIRSIMIGLVIFITCCILRFAEFLKLFQYDSVTM